MNGNQDVYMVGTLAEVKDIDGGVWDYKDSVFINNRNSLQFYIKVISDQPESFPNVRCFTGFTSDMQDLDFEDDIGLLNQDRIDRLKEFFEDNLLIFKPLKTMNWDFGIKEVFQVAKPKDYKSTSTYIPVPIFSPCRYYNKFNDFIDILINTDFIPMIKGISNEDADTPSIIAWESEDSIKIIGCFTSQTYSRGQIKFKFDFLKYKEFDNNWYSNIIRSSEIEDILFVGTDIYTQMEKEIENGVDILQHCGERKIANEELNEMEFINCLKNRISEAGLIYNEKDLINFHVAMKSSNLVILSGMSGTGKSKLVQMYGEALGLDSSQLNIIPVRPSWTDDRDLLGYVDSIHNIYKPGDSTLIDTLIQAKDNIGKLYIICFDEMNLARVEHYFSQFLSILEMDGLNRKINLYSKDIESKLYNSDKYPSEIEIRNNVIFVGTVNLDESTYHFSDKVLDRANVITLSLEDFSKIKNLKVKKKSKYKEIMFDNYDKYKNAQSEITLNDRELEFLNKLNNKINNVNKNIGIGFRIIKQIDTYLKNIPENTALTIKEGWDLQILQRVLTKVRGPQEQMENLIGTYTLNSNISNSDILDLFNEYSDISDFKRSKKCIEDKAKELKIYGYTI